MTSFSANRYSKAHSTITLAKLQHRATMSKYTKATHLQPYTTQQYPAHAPPIIPDEWKTVNFNRDPITGSPLKLVPNTLTETKNAATAAMLTHFKQLIVLVATSPGDGTSTDVAAAHGLQMELHSHGLVNSRFYFSAQECIC